MCNHYFYIMVPIPHICGRDIDSIIHAYYIRLDTSEVCDRLIDILEYMHEGWFSSWYSAHRLRPVLYVIGKWHYARCRYDVLWRGQMLSIMLTDYYIHIIKI